MKLFQNHSAVCLFGEQGRKSSSFFQCAFATFPAYSHIKILSSVGRGKEMYKEQFPNYTHSDNQRP